MKHFSETDDQNKNNNNPFLNTMPHQNVLENGNVVIDNGSIVLDSDSVMFENGGIILKDGAFLKNGEQISMQYKGTEYKVPHGYNNKQIYEYGFSFDEQLYQPIYVNLKQLAWIKKRKARRDYLDSLMVSLKSNYLHESRHRHAMKRLRAPSGRFLTKEETKEHLKTKKHNKM